MRLWQFDRIGGIASSAFDINKKGLEFVSAVLGYLLMTDEQLGFDPTITENQYITITKGGKSERLVIAGVITQHNCIAGRGTRCWKAHREGDESKQLLVVKDSWQYPERDEEGEYLLEATKSGVVNVARYYHHETVTVGGKDDTIVDSVRKGLDISGVENALKIMKKIKEVNEKREDDLLRHMAGATLSSWNRSKDSNTSLSLSKPAVPTTPQEDEVDPPIRDRVHRRVILLDYGQPIYQASSRVAMLAALEGAIKGHQSLRQKAAILHRDISMNNLLSEETNATWSGFLIDLDLAIREKRLEASSAPDKTGTKAFMAIGALDGEKHSFMHDLESFFWVLFWICIHYTGPKGAGRVTHFQKWNFISLEDLAREKSGVINDDRLFMDLTKHATPYFKSLILWMEELRKIVFPNNTRWRVEDEGLYDRMIKVLKDAMMDPNVQAE